MSTLSEAFDTIERAVKTAAERDSELVTQLASLRREVLAEKTIGDGRFEALMKKLDRLDSMLTSLTANGKSHD